MSAARRAQCVLRFSMDPRLDFKPDENFYLHKYFSKENFKCYLLFKLFHVKTLLTVNFVHRLNIIWLVGVRPDVYSHEFRAHIT